MDAVDAGRRWADTWLRGWMARDVEAVAALYHPDVLYAGEPFREPLRGIGEVRGYFVRTFGEEDEVRAWFAKPVVDGQHASIEWWATLLEDGAETTLVGTSTLRFDADGLVVEQRDTWNQASERVTPPETWGR
jgi:ketosteroid isomerase-like protein